MSDSGHWIGVGQYQEGKVVHRGKSTVPGKEALPGPSSVCLWRRVCLPAGLWGQHHCSKSRMGMRSPSTALLYLGAGKLSGTHWPPVSHINSGWMSVYQISQLESSWWSVTECRMPSTVESTAREGHGKALSYISCLIIVPVGGPRNNLSAEMALGKAQRWREESVWLEKDVQQCFFRSGTALCTADIRW